MQSLRSKHHIDMRSAGFDRSAFLGGYAAAHPDDQIGVFVLELAPAAKLAEHFFLRFFADRASVEQKQVSLTHVFGAHVSV